MIRLIETFNGLNIREIPIPAGRYKGFLLRVYGNATTTSITLDHIKDFDIISDKNRIGTFNAKLLNAYNNFENGYFKKVEGKSFDLYLMIDYKNTKFLVEDDDNTRLKWWGMVDADYTEANVEFYGVTELAPQIALEQYNLNKIVFPAGTSKREIYAKEVNRMLITCTDPNASIKIIDEEYNILCEGTYNILKQYSNMENKIEGTEIDAIYIKLDKAEAINKIYLEINASEEETVSMMTISRHYTPNRFRRNYFDYYMKVYNRIRPITEVLEEIKTPITKVEEKIVQK